MDTDSLMLLTAENARKLQQDNPAKLQQLNEILKSISIHVRDSEQTASFIIWYEMLNNVTESKLKEMGYKIKSVSDHDDPMYRISWDE